MLGRTALHQPSLLPKSLPKARPGAHADLRSPLERRPATPRPRGETTRVALEHPRVEDPVPFGADAQPASWLIRFLLVLSMVCGITCVYVWQVSVVQDIRRQTVTMQAELDRIEQDNVSLMLDLVPLESPAYVEAQAKRLGLGLGRMPIYVELPVTALASAGSAATPARLGQASRAGGTTSAAESSREEGTGLLPAAAGQSVWAQSSRAAQRLWGQLSGVARDARSFAASLKARTSGPSQTSWIP